MGSILWSWAITTVAILVATKIVPGVRVADTMTAIIAAAILGILNALVKPVLIVLTLPATILTLGLFIFVLNALMFWFAGSLISGFKVDSFMSALIGSLIVSVVSFVVHRVLG